MSPILKEFLTTDIGLAALVVVGVSIVIIGYIAWLLMAKSAKD
ncbi:MAG: DUF3149 domain-containing protein [Gammaproteobacteria bacterium]|nr:DUF3149 domain-containing protein [Gammaproteobacteria bacterium]MCP5199705.1 DUF3149 domain-containing protein [Gammaproteobacteria bacterium]